eukprot:TRINITY_DN10139_c0_g1_i1.p1 TRINITY_DN10139_c0_g1~~TRINITY_DN10139_c0_g1_i1.p1  ORF type:complete len:228 (-),score=35.60 TRINITY_DN10139_c0_g1_i1:9-692(-)
MIRALFTQLRESDHLVKILSKSFIFGSYLNLTNPYRYHRLANGISISSLLKLRDVTSCVSPDEGVTSIACFRHTSSATPKPLPRQTLLHVLVRSEPSLFQEFYDSFNHPLAEAVHSFDSADTTLSYLVRSLKVLKTKWASQLGPAPEVDSKFSEQFQQFVQFAEPKITQLTEEWLMLKKELQSLTSYLCFKADEKPTTIFSTLNEVVIDFKIAIDDVRRQLNPNAIY